MLRKSDNVDAVFIILENGIIRTPPAEDACRACTNNYKCSGGVVIAANRYDKK